MRSKFMTRLWAAAFGVLVGVSPLMAAENHNAEAMTHVNAAIESGKKGEAAAVGEHAAMAKTHVEMAQKEKANPHLDMAVKSLDSAIEHSKMGHADIAGKAAEEAKTHLDAAAK